MSERLYHIVQVNDRTGSRIILSRPEEPMTHAEACIVLSKSRGGAWERFPHLRRMIQEA
jgi:hypothetical protein